MFIKYYAYNFRWCSGSERTDKFSAVLFEQKCIEKHEQTYFSPRKKQNVFRISESKMKEIIVT